MRMFDNIYFIMYSFKTMLFLKTVVKGRNL